MSSSRRQFLHTSAAVVGASLLGSTHASTSRVPSQGSSEPLEVLILGGTGFVGPHQVEEALARGHRVTTFNRGRRPGFFGDRVEELTGDRDANVGDGLAALAGDRRWDVVIDNSGYVPRQVRDSAELLADRTDRYVFTSTVAAYDYDAAPLVDGVHVANVDAPLHAAPEPATERVTGSTYGPLKAEADRIVLEVYGDRAAIVRPCYIVGPGDNSDRFTYWVERLHKGGDVVCPAGPERVMQWIDVRDLCAFFVTLCESRIGGVFNAVGPASTMTNQEALWALRGFAAAPTRLHWPTTERLEETGFATPMFDWRRSNRRTDPSSGVQAGLKHRSLAETVRDTHLWWAEQSEERRAGARGWPTAEQEAELLEEL